MKINLAIAIPTPLMLYPEFALDSLPALIADAKRNEHIENVYLLWKGGVRTDRNRNLMLKRLYEEQSNFDYILWLDADMVYPDDMISKYVAHAPFDIMGCLYFKKQPPYDPVGYVDGNNPHKPYKNINPDKVEKDKIYEVHGLGFGGMMVSRKLYDEMGDDKWMRYGGNFHLPFDTEDHLTHDLEFCRTARKHGATIFLHGGVRPQHIGTVGVDETFYRGYRQIVSPEQVGEKIYTSNWIDKHKEVWEEHIKPIKNIKSILEIGCYEGRATNWFIENLKPRKYVVVDTFNGSGYLANKNPKDVFLHNTKEHEKIIKIKEGRSQEILPTMQGKFDFIYVDGSHKYEDVKIDAKEAWRLLNPGGYVLFDDYEWYRFGKEDAPKPAIDEFIENTDNLKVIHKGEQVLIKKLKGGEK